MSKQAARLRRVKVVTEDKPQTKEKFLEVAREVVGTQPLMPKFEAANTRQKQALAMLNEGRSVVFLSGSAGTGKSMIAAYRAATLLKQKKADKIYLVRPAVSVGKSVGLVPGDLNEKLSHYFAQTVAHLEYFMGKGFTKYCLEHEVIELRAVEYLRGTSFENCVCIFEEIQNFTDEEFEMVLTRLGNGAQFILTGDFRQHDLKGVSGLSTTIKMLQRMQDEQPDYLSDDDLQIMEDMIGIVEFQPEDVVRSGLTRAFVKMYHNN